MPNPWSKPECDAKVDGDGRVRLCGESPAAAVHQLEQHGSIDTIVANAADAYMVAHSALFDAGIGPERPAAARRLADAWIELRLVIAVRRKAKP